MSVAAARPPGFWSATALAGVGGESLLLGAVLVAVGLPVYRLMRRR